MHIILKEDVDKVGNKNDIVSVKTGFARNFLIPQGKAICATESARKVVAEDVRQQSHKAAKALEAAAKNIFFLEDIDMLFVIGSK